MLVRTAAGQGAQQVGAGDHPAGAPGQGLQQGHPGGRDRAQLVVDQDGVAPDLDAVPGDGQRTGAGGQFAADELDERAEPEAFRLDGVDAPGLQRHGGDRADAGRYDVTAQRRHDLGQQPAFLGAAEQRGRRRSAGEGERVQGAGGGQVEDPVERRDVLRRHPAVDGDGDHLGAGLAQRLHEAGKGFAVQLERDAAAPYAFLQEPFQHLGHGLGGRRPGFGEAGGADGALHLGAARQEFDPAQGGEEPVADAPAVGRLDPAPEADRGGGDDHVGRLVDQLLRRGEQFAVVGERHDPQGGGVHHGGAPAPQQGAQLLRPARGGDTDREAREGPVLCVVVLYVVHEVYPALVPLLLVGAEDRACQRRVTDPVQPHFPLVTSPGRAVRAHTSA